MGKSTFRRSRIIMGKDGAGQDILAHGITPGAYMLWDASEDKLIFAGGADMDFGSFGTPLVINQANNYPLGIFGEVSVANSEGTNVERSLWVRTKVSASQTGAFSIFGGQLQFRWADGAKYLGTGTENAQYGGAWLYLEQDTAGQELKDYAHASGAVIQVETFGALTIPTNAHLSGLKIESRLGAANGEAISLNSGTIAGLFITKSPAASGVTAQNWPYGIFIENSDIGISVGDVTTGLQFTGTMATGISFSGATLLPDADRTDIAIEVGSRASPLTITMLNQASQHFNPIQICGNIVGANPTNASSVSLIRMSSAHSDVAMSYLRLRHINSYMFIEKDLQDAYIYTGSMDFYTSAIAVGGEAAVMNLNMECNSEVTGKVRGLIINIYGNGLPSATSIGLEMRVDGSTAATLGEGIRIWSVGGNSITTGLQIQGSVACGVNYAATLTPDAGRTNYAFAIGNRDGELSVNLGNAADQNVEPFQMNVNFTASEGAPTSSSTARLLRIRSTHDTVDMPNLRIMNINTYMDVQKNMEAAYGQMNGIDFTTNAVELITEAAVAAFNMECTAAVTGKVRGIIINMHGATLPSTSIGVEVRTDGGTATLGEGVRIWSVGGNSITTGLNFLGTFDGPAVSAGTSGSRLSYDGAGELIAQFYMDYTLETAGGSRAVMANAQYTPATNSGVGSLGGMDGRIEIAGAITLTGTGTMGQRMFGTRGYCAMSGTSTGTGVVLSGVEGMLGTATATLTTFESASCFTAISLLQIDPDAGYYCAYLVANAGAIRYDYAFLTLEACRYGLGLRPNSAEATLESGIIMDASNISGLYNVIELIDLAKINYFLKTGAAAGFLDDSASHTHNNAAGEIVIQVGGNNRYIRTWKT